MNIQAYWNIETFRQDQELFFKIIPNLRESVNAIHIWDPNGQYTSTATLALSFFSGAGFVETISNAPKKPIAAIFTLFVSTGMFAAGEVLTKNPQDVVLFTLGFGTGILANTARKVVSCFNPAGSN